MSLQEIKQATLQLHDSSDLMALQETLNLALRRTRVPAQTSPQTGKSTPITDSLFGIFYRPNDTLFIDTEVDA